MNDELAIDIRKNHIAVIRRPEHSVERDRAESNRTGRT